MALTIEFSQTPSQDSDVLIVPVTGEKAFTLPAGITLKPENLTFVTDVLNRKKSFQGKSGQSLPIELPEGEAYKSVVFAGFAADGDDEEDESLLPVVVQKAATRLYPLLGKEWSKATFAMTPEFLAQEQNRDAILAEAAKGLTLGSYEFKQYKSKKPPAEGESAEPPKDKTIHFTGPNAAEAALVYKSLKGQAEGVFLARDLARTPSNEKFPQKLADTITAHFKGTDVGVETFDDKQMAKLGPHGMGMFLAVGQGSVHLPRMTVLRWMGADDPNEPPVLFVGKGVTFDTGGISIKPSAGMEDMKADMHGAATGVGLVHALAARKAKVNVVAVLGFAENMPSGSAVKPGDIVTSYTGETVEILNTDAEGRLVLGDCLAWGQETFKPKKVINMATLTGAIITSLGDDIAGLFPNKAADSELTQQLMNASQKTGELIWQQPRHSGYTKDMDGTFADARNHAKKPGAAGSAKAAAFLRRFIKPGVQHAHIDIAGVAMRPDGGTGWGVQLLDRWVKDHCEPSSP